MTTLPKPRIDVTAIKPWIVSFKATYTIDWGVVPEPESRWAVHFLLQEVDGPLDDLTVDEAGVFQLRPRGNADELIKTFHFWSHYPGSPRKEVGHHRFWVARRKANTERGSEEFVLRTWLFLKGQTPIQSEPSDVISVNV